MRKILLSAALLLLLCACERETLTDPVLFCKNYNRGFHTPVIESDMIRRADNEVAIFCEDALIRLKLNEDGAVCTAVVTGNTDVATASVIQRTFSVLAEPLSESVPQSVIDWAQADGRFVQTVTTKRFFYSVFQDGESVTAVQVNLLLSSIPALPSVRPSESE